MMNQNSVTHLSNKERKRIERKSKTAINLDQSSSPRKIKLEVEYDGSDFLGFQSQDSIANYRTVQSTIELAILRLTGEKMRIQGASRTDKGVHAKGQVISFITRSSRNDGEIVDGLNTRLPKDVAIRSAVTVGDTFNPRKCIDKTYTYHIQHGCIRPALKRNYVWHVRDQLCIDKMKITANHFIGKPLDFTSFTPKPLKTQSAAVNNVCHISAIVFLEYPDNLLNILITGDRFVFKLIRTLVGVMVDAGLEKIIPDEIPNIFESRDRNSCKSQSAPAQ
eukprot:Pgem_evm1s1117